MRKKNLKISIRLKLGFFAMTVVLIFTVIVYGVVIPLVEREKHIEREATLKAITDSALSLIRYYEHGIRLKKWQTDPAFPSTRGEAQKRVIENLRQLKYGKDDHIFILNGSAELIMHPLKPELEGKNLEKIEAPDNSFPFRQMAVKAQQSDIVFVKYTWLSKWSMTVYEPQTTCAQYFYPWDWVVCTSMYTQDIDDAVGIIKRQTTIYIAVGSILGLGVLYLIGILISKPIVMLSDQVEKLSDHENHIIDNAITVKTKDEIGLLANTFRNTFKTLQTTLEQLKNSEEKYKQLVENATDAIFIAQDEKIKFANNQTLKMLGYSLGELKTNSFLEFVHPDDRSLVIDRYTRRLKGDKRLPTSYSIKLVNKDGSELTVQISAVMVEWEGKPASLTFARDITEQKRLEISLQQAQKMQAIGTLAGGIAHDFNNILSGIFGYTQLAAMSITDADKVKKNIDSINEGAQRAAKLVQQILTFSRQKEFKKDNLYLYVVVKEVVKLLRSSIPATIEIKEEIYSKAMIFADPTRIHQMIMNLGTNAYHSMSESGGILTLKLEEVNITDPAKALKSNISLGNYLKLEVSDTGKGMDDETLEKIFDPYFTTKEIGKGTGLGLALVHAIVQEHKGFIRVNSTFGKGTQFLIYLPAKGKKHKEKIVKKQSETTVATKTARLMMVDDEKDILLTTSKILKASGFDVTSYEDGLKALNAFKKSPFNFDLIITDMAMPKMAGDELAKSILDIRHDVPVILCTGFSDKLKNESFKKIGIKRLLQKPVISKQLLSIIDEIINEN